MINLKIDVSKITKSRLFKGKKGVYLDAKLIETPNSEYGDYMIVESTSKEEYEQGVKGAILGNAKEFKKQGSTNGSPTNPLPVDNFDTNENHNLPF